MENFPSADEAEKRVHRLFEDYYKYPNDTEMEILVTKEIEKISKLIENAINNRLYGITLISNSIFPVRERTTDFLRDKGYKVTWRAHICYGGFYDITWLKAFNHATDVRWRLPCSGTHI